MAGKELSCNDDESVHNHIPTSTDSQEKISAEHGPHGGIGGSAVDDETSFSPSECVRILKDIKESNKHFQRQQMEHQKQNLKALHNISQELAHIYMSKKRLRYIVLTPLPLIFH